MEGEKGRLAAVEGLLGQQSTHDCTLPKKNVLILNEVAYKQF